MKIYTLLVFLLIVAGCETPPEKPQKRVEDASVSVDAGSGDATTDAAAATDVAEESE